MQVSDFALNAVFFADYSFSEGSKYKSFAMPGFSGLQYKLWILRYKSRSGKASGAQAELCHYSLVTRDPAALLISCEGCGTHYFMVYGFRVNFYL